MKRKPRANEKHRTSISSDNLSGTESGAMVAENCERIANHMGVSVNRKTYENIAKHTKILEILEKIRNPRNFRRDVGFSLYAHGFPSFCPFFQRPG